MTSGMDEYGAGTEASRRRTAVIGVTVVAVFVLAVIAAWSVMAFTGSGGTAPGRGGAAGSGEPLRVVATIPPLAWPVRELTPHAELTVLMEPGSTPHGMELSPAGAKALAEADVVLAVGMGLDDTVLRALEARPREGREVVVLEECLAGAGIEPVASDGHDHAHDHDHGHDHAHDHHGHDHGPIDPHAWLDPAVMRVFVGRVDSALGRASGGASSGRVMLQERCDSVDNAYRLALGNLSTSIICQHNAYGYLANRYGLEVVAVLDVSGAGEVAPGDVKAVMDAIRAHRVGAIFIEPQTSPAVAERIASEMGVRVLTLDPLGDGDWPELMDANLEALVDGLSSPAPGTSGGGPAQTN